MWRKRGMSFPARLIQPEAISGSTAGLPNAQLISKGQVTGAAQLSKKLPPRERMSLMECTRYVMAAL